jgi:Protein of unknown function (DUF2867)
MAGTQLADSEHTSRPWRIHELTADFRLEDVWALATPGGPYELPLLVDGIVTGDPAEIPSRPARALWSIRWKLGELFGWDEPESGLEARVPTLRDRLPEDLLAAPGPAFASLPFTPLYLTEDEFAAEIANRTVHGVMHIGWVREGEGYLGQMAVLVKPNGSLGAAYMAAIRPFRHRVVYPAMLRQIEREWQRRKGGHAAAADQRSSALRPLVDEQRDT